ncbi:DUF4190 domain-containing protein [Rhodopirellula sp. JC740]|uniref:DUF4190 domain-containing protein n=1 Tax=Rhodopirellula halodulae TaxID=2894198 RepID=A0ABS8NMV6_9BACT|nr:DUF4190 domain-containing protein [Rhodopirellula sp. JC740]MCC9644870.1 DUF4190 domain-containing protein [Rhodopirellula sp. JC740]
MSAEVQFTGAADAAEFPYKAINRGSIASLVFLGLALPGLMGTFSPMLVLAVPGILAAIVALRSIRRYPDEYSGAGVAKFGLVGCLLLFVGGIGFHTYTYLTEVPDGYERVAFYKLQAEPNGPDQPTEDALSIDGDAIFLKGYIHPSSGSGMLRQFVLVPDLGTCCFGGDPRSSDMIEVTLPPGESVRAGLTKRKLAGTFRVNRIPQSKDDFKNSMFYKIRVDQYE